MRTTHPHRSCIRRTVIVATALVASTLVVAGAATADDDVVSIGDSYASGEGVTPFQPGTATAGVNECHRSDAAHPAVLADLLGVELGFWACSGSTTATLRSSQVRTTGPPWNDPVIDVGGGDPRAAIDRIEPGVTDRVLVTIGGNDIGFGDIVSDCLLGSTSCTNRAAEVEAALAELGPAVDELLEAVRDRLEPAGQIVVVGYPRLLPTLPVGACDFLPLLPGGVLTVEEQAWANDVTGMLNAVLEGAVHGHQDRLDDIVFVDTADRFDGQELCRATGGTPATTSPMVIGLDLADPEHSFHPTAAGQERLADAAMEHLLPTGPGPTVGSVDPTTGIWRLRDADGFVTSFYYGDPGDYPIAGDWDCDGIDTPGMYRQSDGYVYLRNSNSQGVADRRFFFGNPGDVPIVGDFDGDGCDTVSVYRPSQSRVFIIDELGADDQGLGAATTNYVFGDPGDTPFVGDFDGDGIDTIGLHRDTTGLVYFRNSHTQGIADAQFVFGDPEDRLIAGDWNGDSFDSPAVLRPSSERFFFRFTNTAGVADRTLAWSFPVGIPVTGVFSP